MKKRILILLFGVLLVLLSSNAVRAENPSEGWSEDIRVTNNLSDSISPSADIGPDGSLHIVWAENKHIYYERIAENGTVLVDKKDIYWNGALPIVRVDANNNAHIVSWVGFEFVLYIKIDNYGNKLYHKVIFLSQDIDMTNPVYEWPSISVDPTDNLPVLTWDARGSIYDDINMITYYINKVSSAKLDSSGKVLNSKTLIMDTSTQPIFNYESTSVSVDNNGGVHAVWKDKEGSSVFNLAYYDGLNVYIIVANNLDYPHITTDSSNNAHIVFQKDGDVYYSDGISIERLTNTGSSAVPKIAAAPNNTLYVVWSDNRDGNQEIYFKESRDRGFIWNVDSRLTNNSASSQYPSIGADLFQNNTYVVWSDNRDGNREIYYKKKIGVPTANFTYSPGDPFVKEEITFDASSSYDSDGTIVKYEWNFGDGISDKGIQINHTYYKSGNYTVNLIVTDNDGLKDSFLNNITVNTPCSKTNTSYWPKDTKCKGIWPDHEGSLIHINEDNFACDLFEVCDKNLDPIINEAENCCSNACNGNCHSFCDNAYDSSKLREGYSDSKFKKCKGLYLIYGLGPSKRFMQDYYYPELRCSGLNANNSNISCGYDPTTSISYTKAAPLKCQGIVNQPRGWFSDSDLTKDSCIFSDLPAHVSINKISTGTCVDYSTSLTTLLRKADFSLNEVYSVTAPCHAYNLVKFPGNRKWVIVDTVGNSPNTYKPGDKPGWSWNCSGIIYDHCDYYSCANDNGTTACPSKANVYGCGTIGYISPTSMQDEYQNDLNSFVISTNKTFNNLIIIKTTSDEIMFGSVLEVNISIYNNNSIQNNITIKEIVENAMPIDPAKLNMEQIPEGLIAALPPFYYWNLSLDPYESKLISYKIRPLNPGEYILGGTKIFTNNTTETDNLVINILCNQNKICELSIGENYFTCKNDCSSGSQDDICDLQIDGVCDPDCLPGYDPDCIETVNMSLNKSWNLISIPLNLSNNSIENVFGQIMNKVIVINSFESGVGGGARTYDPLLPEFSDLHNIDYLHGYWVKMNQSANLTINGTIPINKTINLLKNWNLISYLCDTNKSVESVFGSIMDKVIVINGFENGALTYDPLLPEFSDLIEMKPNFGYWVKMNQSAVLDYEGVC